LGCEARGLVYTLPSSRQLVHPSLCPLCGWKTDYRCSICVSGGTISDSAVRIHTDWQLPDLEGVPNATEVLLLDHYYAQTGIVWCGSSKDDSKDDSSSESKDDSSSEDDCSRFGPPPVGRPGTRKEFLRQLAAAKDHYRTYIEAGFLLEFGRAAQRTRREAGGSA